MGGQIRTQVKTRTSTKHGCGDGAVVVGVFNDSDTVRQLQQVEQYLHVSVNTLSIFTFVYL